MAWTLVGAYIGWFMRIVYVDRLGPRRYFSADFSSSMTHAL
jgi:hypothetical protein